MLDNDTLIRTTGIYRHYKGGEYIFLAEGVDMETGDMVVIYKSSHDGTIWCRPFMMFHDWVNDTGQVVEKLDTNSQRRFEMIKHVHEKNFDLSKLLLDTKIRHSETGDLYTCYITRRGTPKLDKISSDNTLNKIQPLLSKN